VIRYAERLGVGRRAGRGRGLIVPSGPGPERQISPERWRVERPNDFAVACGDAYAVSLGLKDEVAGPVFEVQPADSESVAETLLVDIVPVVAGGLLGAGLTNLGRAKERLQQSAALLSSDLANLGVSVERLVSETGEGTDEGGGFVVAEQLIRLRSDLLASPVEDVKRATRTLDALEAALDAPTPKAPEGQAGEQRAASLDAAWQAVDAEVGRVIGAIRKRTATIVSSWRQFVD